MARGAHKGAGKGRLRIRRRRHAGGDGLTEAHLAAALAVPLALAIDRLGDPRDRLHPTAWMGAIAARLAPGAARSASPRAAGALVVALMVGAASVPALLLVPALWGLPWAAHAAALLASSAILLKVSLAMRGMERGALGVAECAERGDLGAARNALARITKRRTGSLGRDGVLSGAIESVGDNTTDAVTGPLFYYGLLGAPGALAYRAAGTADSMMGYRSPQLREAGWPAASLETALTYLPARLTGLAVVAAAALLRLDWRGSCRVMLRDGGRTQSRNSGYAMAAMAGALGARLEKEGCYVLEGGPAAPSARDVRLAVRMMRVSSLLVAGLFSAPLAAAIHAALYAALHAALYAPGGTLV
ncbi:MAG: adenosylcobinamide-phosphate synthase CbiB [Nitrosopumilus sp.]|nr:adenosylcobinamide-phosphate synthase CbiB [Nitrosopumilus sp.]MDA7958404.1 adenosylcobinamide-phosphate synthase CbiB [Nitrosopumilus sp.]